MRQGSWRPGQYRSPTTGLARKIAERVAMLYDGKIIWNGHVAVDNSGNPYVDQCQRPRQRHDQEQVAHLERRIYMARARLACRQELRRRACQMFRPLRGCGA